eukprot:SAG22_NODE_3884_length_1483_cov_7.346098_1_plen_133_part_10
MQLHAVHVVDLELAIGARARASSLDARAASCTRTLRAAIATRDGPGRAGGSAADAAPLSECPRPRLPRGAAPDIAAHPALTLNPSPARALQLGQMEPVPEPEEQAGGWPPAPGPGAAGPGHPLTPHRAASAGP